MLQLLKQKNGNWAVHNQEYHRKPDYPQQQPMPATPTRHGTTKVQPDQQTANHLVLWLPFGAPQHLHSAPRSLKTRFCRLPSKSFLRRSGRDTYPACPASTAVALSPCPLSLSLRAPLGHAIDRYSTACPRVQYPAPPNRNCPTRQRAFRRRGHCTDCSLVPSRRILATLRS